LKWLPVSRQRPPCLLSIVIAASCALLFAIATDELFNGRNSNGEIAVGLCVEGPVLLNIWEFPHRSRQSSYHTQFILTLPNDCANCDISQGSLAIVGFTADALSQLVSEKVDKKRSESCVM
jgi:hypothetical protein